MEETILTAKDLKFRYDPEQPDYALNGVSASTDQLTTLLDASTQIQNGIAQLDAGAAQLDEQVSYDAYKAILKENGLDLDQLKDGNAKAMEQLEQLLRTGRFYDLPDLLIRTANENGGPDNITALLLGVEPLEVHHG